MLGGMFPAPRSLAARVVWLVLACYARIEQFAHERKKSDGKKTDEPPPDNGMPVTENVPVVEPDALPETVRTGERRTSKSNGVQR